MGCIDCHFLIDNKTVFAMISGAVCLLFKRKDGFDGQKTSTTAEILCIYRPQTSGKTERRTCICLFSSGRNNLGTKTGFTLADKRHGRPKTTSTIRLEKPVQILRSIFAVGRTKNEETWTRLITNNRCWERRCDAREINHSKHIQSTRLLNVQGDKWSDDSKPRVPPTSEAKKNKINQQGTHVRAENSPSLRIRFSNSVEFCE